MSLDVGGKLKRGRRIVAWLVGKARGHVIGYYELGREGSYFRGLTPTTFPLNELALSSGLLGAHWACRLTICHASPDMALLRPHPNVYFDPPVRLALHKSRRVV